jgi:hypothetical protein
MPSTSEHTAKIQIITNQFNFEKPMLITCIDCLHDSPANLAEHLSGRKSLPAADLEDHWN